MGLPCQYVGKIGCWLWVESTILAPIRVSDTGVICDAGSLREHLIQSIFDRTHAHRLAIEGGTWSNERSAGEAI